MLAGIAAMSFTTTGTAFAAAAAATDSTATANVDELIVTGSRIARQDYVAASPMVTVGPSAMRKALLLVAPITPVMKRNPPESRLNIARLCETFCLL